MGTKESEAGIERRGQSRVVHGRAAGGEGGGGLTSAAARGMGVGGGRACREAAPAPGGSAQWCRVTWVTRRASQARGCEKGRLRLRLWLWLQRRRRIAGPCLSGASRASSIGAERDWHFCRQLGEGRSRGLIGKIIKRLFLCGDSWAKPELCDTARHFLHKYLIETQRCFTAARGISVCKCQSIQVEA